MYLKSYYSSLISKSVSPSVLWKSIKSVLPTKSSTWEMFQCNPTILANNFNQHFVSVSSVVAPRDIPTSDCSLPTMVSNHLDLKSISTEDCLELINTIPTNKSHGPDNIPPAILKSVGPVVAPPLTGIINSSLSSGHFPTNWKQACVKPLHKGGDKSELINYRPISLLPTCSKLLEQVVRTQLVNHLEENNILYPLQSGFQPNHSTASSLLRTTNDWFKALDAGHVIGVLFLDVSKAFDTVDHSLLHLS